MAVKIVIRTIESEAAAEIYISATPQKAAPLQTQAAELFSAIRDTLRSKKAHILQERIFVTQEAVETVRSARSKAYKDIDDGVAPSILVGKETTSGPFAGTQVHTIISDIKPQVINLQEIPCGRILRIPGHTILTLSGICAPQLTRPTDQAHTCLEKAQAALKQFNADFLSVARTWVWLKDILTWYDDFNGVRNKFFTEIGLIGKGSRQSMPASTGIGLYCAGGDKCTIDLIATLEPKGWPQFLPAVGKQQCALEYGSAFSRASRAITPAGETVFVSGTASIDASGATIHIGDAVGQINTTIDNVRAVLADMNCRDEDVVHATAYCKTTEVENIFNGIKGNINWPWITTICDVCRPDLLFEMEATAIAKANYPH
jgi:enamine deaminase RidA (YjgF/YER057c/UK114 family)